MATGESFRLVHVLAGTGFGGAERVACTLARFATRDGYQVTLDGAPGTRTGTSEYGLTGVAEENTVVEWTRAARQRVRALAPTLVHVHLSTPSLLSSALRIAGSYPTLLTLHLLPEQRWPLDRLTRIPSKWLLALGTRCQRKLYINTVSHTDRTKLHRIVPTSRLSAIINAPPSTGAEPTGPMPGWPLTSVRLLVVGRLVPQKGHQRLLQALASPEVLSLDWHLAVVGDGPERARLTQLSHALGLSHRVSWTGAAPSAPWLRQADLVVSPSLYEGMPLVPLEAIREGTPVLTSNIPPHRELFAQAAPESILPSAPEAWPNVLAAHLASSLRRADLAVSQHGLTSFCDPERQWREYRELYARIAQT